MPPSVDQHRPFRSHQVYASQAAAELLSRNGLADIESVFRRCESAASRHPGRAVCEARLSDGDRVQQRVFVKLNWGRRRLWPRMTDLRTGQLYWSKPAREWVGLGRLESLGLLVPERLAYFEHGVWKFHSAVIVRAVPPRRSIYEMLLDGTWRQLAERDRRSIVEQIAATLGRIHAAQLGWRGTSTGHFYPEKLGDGSWRVWLIDCEGVHTRATPRSFQRDYEKIARCFSRAGAESFTLEHLRATFENAPRRTAKAA